MWERPPGRDARRSCECPEASWTGGLFHMQGRSTSHGSMIRFATALLLLSAACAPPAPQHVRSQAHAAIAYGAADSAHDAVVALLADEGVGAYSLCTGTIVQIRSGQAYVLTAAHCCNQTPPSLAVVANDYG